MATVVTWLGCDLVTGQIIEELPDLAPSGSISAMLGAYTSASFQLPIALGGNGAPPKEWLSATEIGRAMIVAVLAGEPIWAGIVLAREGGTEAVADLACVTLEGYLNQRYVGDHEWLAEDEASVIAAGLIGDANDVEGIGFDVDASPTGILRDSVHLDQDDKTVYSALRELQGQGGPEWTVVLGWTDSTQTAVSKKIRIASRIGFASSAPDAVFTTGSASAVVASAGASEARYSFAEDYSTGRGANHIIATSSGEGLSRPQSFPARDEARIAAGMPRYEYRFSPGSSITDLDVLDAHAQKALTIMAAGSRTVSIIARADVTPVLGTDWFLGDDLGYDLVGHRHPGGLQGVARAIGWELDPLKGVVSPILFAPELEGST